MRSVTSKNTMCSVTKSMWIKPKTDCAVVNITDVGLETKNAMEIIRTTPLAIFFFHKIKKKLTERQPNFSASSSGSGTKAVLLI